MRHGIVQADSLMLHGVSGSVIGAGVEIRVRVKPTTARQRFVGLRSRESLTGSELAGWVELPPWFAQRRRERSLSLSFGECPLSAVDRTSGSQVATSESDPEAN